MIAVIGGGWFGSYHARQLLKAVRGGRLPDQGIVVVDRSSDCAASREFAGAAEVSLLRADWAAFLRDWLPTAADEDQLVPAPIAPHLTWDWLARELRTIRLPVPRGWRLPYEQPGPDGALYLSAAAWVCPATCVEPPHCPALHAPRDWDLAEIIAEAAAERGWHPAIFRCLHLANGVGAIAAGDLRRARFLLARAPFARPVLVATSSRCHAAVGLLAAGPSG